jgi:RNA polymerase sigma-70 factor (ECF subfamily)
MFRAHYGAVLAYALRRADPDDARDVAAETFLVAWRRFGDAPGDSQLPWLYGVARRTLANQRRSASRRQALELRLRPLLASSPVDHDHTLTEALDRLAEPDREALLLVAWEGLNTDEAARVLGCRPTAFRMRLHRARRRLAAMLEEPAPEAPSTPSMERAS